MAKQQKTSEPTLPSRQLVTATPPPASLQLQERSCAGAAAFGSIDTGTRETPRSLPLIKIDHREGHFILPSGEVADKISGYPLFKFSTRQYYAHPPRPGEPGKPPDCYSLDMIRPDARSSDQQAELCCDCPQSEWGSSRTGAGQACATKLWIFLVNPEFGAAGLACLICPPSSLRYLEGNMMTAGYFGQAEARHQRYEVVWSTFALQQEGDQVKYCTIVPVMGEPADAERGGELARLKARMLSAMLAIKGETTKSELGEETA